MSSHHVPAWLVRSCRWLTRGYGWVWSCLLNIVLSLIATWLFTASGTDFKSFPVMALWQHWLITLVALLVLFLLTGLAWAIGKLPVIEAPRVLKRQYLNNWIYQTRDLAIEGILLVPARVQLDEIFIAMQLRPHQSSIDQLLTKEQSRLLREEMRRGRVAKDVERVLVDAERQYELLLRKHDRIEIEDLWQRLTREHPAAVIQGYPGMGKSTLLLRLTLYMARHGLGMADSLEKPLAPILVPLFIRLGRYTTFRQQAKNDTNPSIWKYLESSPKDLADLTTPPMLAWLRRCLEHGQCLVLFDGLDEVSDPQERFDVQEAIKAFITDACSKASGATGYNRFLITSRVAGYDQNAFPGYPHYTIAELTPKQIEKFLPRWCRACVRGDMQGATQEEIERQVTRQATTMEEKLKSSIQGHQGIRELVENPFLLTLLAIMQQNGIDLPHRRVELYSTMTQVLLETRNARRNLPIIPEAQAIQRLGPVAYQMQETKNSFATRHDVLASFASTIKQLERVSPEQAQTEAEAFLKRVRERGGIFVLRTGDYLGFFHRTFQEYFAARHLLRLLATDPQEIEDLLDKARQLDDLWREPFLLAVAYKTKDEAPVACQIMKCLLARLSGASQEQRFHDTVLVGECLVEAKEATIPPELERDVVMALLHVYEEALQDKNNVVCVEVEDVMQRLLQNVSREAEHSALLQTLQEALLDTQHFQRLRAVLILLTLIAQDLRPCADVVFDRIVPPLLGLTGLPAVDQFIPLLPTTDPDFDTVDLALAALSFLGARGPAGISLKQVRPRFEQHLEQLARYSLRSGFLITPAVVPLERENYQHYKACARRWLQLYDQVKQGKRTIEQAILSCASIHRDLLETAEEICYPAEGHFLQMLERSQSYSGRAWQMIWQDYLHEQMNIGTYVDYQICALLWATLFPDQQAQQDLAAVLLEHFHENTKIRCYAQHFLSRVVRDLGDLEVLRNAKYLANLRKLGDVRDARDVRYLGNLRYWGYLGELEILENLGDLVGLEILRNSEYVGYLVNLGDLGDLRESKHLGNWKDSGDLEDLGVLRDLRGLRGLSKFLLKGQIAIDVEQRLQTCAETEQTELLMLLFGRVLQIREDNDTGQKVEQEIQHIVQVILPFAQSSNDARDVVLDIVRYLPARTEQEIIFVFGLARDTLDADIQQVFGSAIRRSHPASDAAWAVLEQGRTSPVAVIREAVEERLKERQKQQI